MTMDFDTWLFRKEKMPMQKFLSLENPQPFYDRYDEYRSKVARFHAEIILRDCRETAKELVALG